MRLNPEQQLAVQQKGHVLLLAGAGAGKTLVLAHRAAALLQSDQGNLVAVTFTKDSADELKRRIIRMSPGQEKRILTGTFHALAMRQLRSVGMDIKLLNNGDRNRLILHAMAKTEEELDLEDISKIIDKAKSELTHKDYDGPGYKTFHAYQDLLHAEKRMDFADLIGKAVDGMQAGTVPPLQSRWVLGDEFQDVDEAQYAWLMLHQELTGAELTMVGDDDQSIYAFRHALGYTGMERMRAGLNAHVLHLSRNYRCAPEVLAPAARLIQHNTHRAEKNIIAAAESGGHIECVFPRDREEESEWFINRLREEPSGWAILSRTNRLLDVMEIELQQHNIPYFRESDDDFWDTKEPRAVLTMLSGIVGGSRALAMPKGKSHGSLLKNTAITNRLAAYRREMFFGCRAALFLCGWKADITDALLNQLEPVPMNDWKPILNGFKEQWDKENNNKSPRLSNGLQFMENLQGWCLISVQDPVLFLEGVKRWNQKLLPVIAESCGIALTAIQRLRGSLAQRIQFVEGLSKKKDEPPQLGPETVILTTMHGSKGLEWPNVWIIGLEEGVVPHQDSEIEEERRLFYVAMTRARRKLVISAVREGTPSRFLAEAQIDEVQ